MTQAQLDHAVAAATGETVATVHRRGFSILPAEPRDPGDEPWHLVVACPHCGRAVDYPGRARDGAPILAECLDCDIYFAADPAAVTLSASPEA